MTIEIHPTAKVSALADIEVSVRGTKVVIGPRTVIDAFVKFKPAGGKGDVVIGADCVLNSGCVVYTGNGLTIGDGVAVAANTTFAPVNHAFMDKNRTIREQRFLPSKGGIVIGDDVWIGANCVILDGACISDGAVVGAMSLVRGNVAPYSVVAGNPLRQISERT
ncbi:acyltransferase [Echinimonas agarilytica]|uniref:Acyltransferase n=1 Tax=Echinimonas agarilytica TaxID=1215918 RepID=A0AA41W530_9GAMM|nr:acyltransferase [Echinimonas agarilytica]MCM2678951.1 acyltransferase [Echinimonas agarilytica]